MADSLIDACRRLDVSFGGAGAIADTGYVVHLSDPPTPQERLQLMAARLQRRPIAIMPHKYTMEEWIARYGSIETRTS